MTQFLASEVAIENAFKERTKVYERSKLKQYLSHTKIRWYR
jgi:hypothetical protein